MIKPKSPVPVPINKRRKGLVAIFLYFFVSILVLRFVVSPALESSKFWELVGNSGNGIPAPTNVLKEIPVKNVSLGIRKVHHQDQLKTHKANTLTYARRPLTTLRFNKTLNASQGYKEFFLFRRLSSRLPENTSRFRGIPDTLTNGRFQIWLGDPECENFTIQFAPQHTFKPRALVSFPRSGNTWLRHLIESSTGYFTGSIYGDKTLFQSGYLGETREPTDGTTILQKTHHNSNYDPNVPSFGKTYLREIRKSEAMFKYRGVLIIRNPFQALISLWQFLSTKTFLKSTMEPGFDTLEWKNFAQPRAPLWANLIQDWIQNSSDLLVVQYEDLTLDTEKELSRILTYLKIPIDPARLKCTLKSCGKKYEKRN